MTGQQAVEVMLWAKQVEADKRVVEAELQQELDGVVEWSTSVYGVAVDDTPHAAVLRDQLSVLNEELDACHMCMNV